VKTAFTVLHPEGRLVSAGLERLVYTEKVGGSNPSAPTVFLIEKHDKAHGELMPI
jgi:hypothetical protein